MVQKGADGFEEPGQRPTYFLRVVVGDSKVSVDILDGGLHRVESVSQRFQVTSSHDVLRLAEAELLGPPAGFVLSLPARSPAVQPRAAWARRGIESAGAPLAPSRHR
jgi:hypothetical protein